MLQGKHRISFGGGGISYSYTATSSSTSKLELEQSESVEDTFDFTGAFEFTPLGLFGLKCSLALGGKYEKVRCRARRS